MDKRLNKLKRAGEIPGIKAVVDLRKRIPDGKGGTKVYGTASHLQKAAEHGLTDFEFSFIQKVLMDPLMNATRAYMELSDCVFNTASGKATELMNSERVKNYYNDVMDARMKTGIVTETEILFNLKTLTLRCMQGEEVKDKNGNGIGEYQFNASAAKSALELMGKNIGMFKDKLEISGIDGAPIETINTDMSAAEATALYTKNMKKGA